MNTAIDSAVTETLLYHEQTKRHFHQCFQESPTPAGQGLALVARQRIAQRLQQAEVSFGGFSADRD